MSEIKDPQQERTASAPGATAAVAAAGTPGVAPRSRFPSLNDLLRGDLGQVPVFIALIVIAIYFQIASGGFFLIPRNITELVGEIITIGSVGLAAVFVLLIGEIDLSLAAVASLTGSIMVVLLERAHWGALFAVLGALVCGALIGLLNGIFVAVLRMPSFIVTLAGLIGYQGVLLRVLEPQTTVPLRDDRLVALAIYNVPDVIGVGLPLLCVVIYALFVLRDRARRQRLGLVVNSPVQVGARLGLTALIVIGVIALFESYQGVPLSAMILVGMIAFFWLITERTTFGRHIYAVGGNAEAARRAGINVTQLRITLFVLASTVASVGGILQVSHQVSASSAVESTLLLNAIAAAVIGGVSLFGGRGSVWAVVLGALVVGSLINGLALTGQSSATELMVEGAVLLVAVLVDALLRRRNAVTGR